VIEENITITEKLDRDLIDLSPLGIAYLNADGTILHTNPMLLQMMEVSEGNGNHQAKMKLQKLLSILVADDNRSILDLLLVGETIQFKEVEFSLISGVKKWMNISGKPNFDLDGKVIGAVLMCSDITDYKELQAQLQQAQKMEALGQLTSGVAHDFNNLLTVIMGNTELVLLKLESNSPLQNNVEEILKAAERATKLTRRLLAFSRRQPVESSIIDLNEIIRDIERMLQHTLRENIELDTVAEPNLWKIEADPGQIEQVIINLTVNSRDAMLHGGRLIIETANTELNQDYAGGKPEVKPGKYVMLAITDTGCGMTKEVKEKVFDPFFTTKETGKGTGLGLSTTYSFIKQLGGYIWVYSEPEQGTTFRIYLPVAEKETGSFNHTVKNDKIPQGSESILVVEDEDEVRKTVVTMLIRHGYKVDAFRNGREALSFCREQKEPVQFLLTDYILPDINGIEVADKLRDTWPEVKVLITSGYSTTTINQQRAQKMDYPCIQKPFSLTNLVTLVRNILDS